MIGLLVSSHAHALSDEIDVYTGEITPPGLLNLTVHANEVVASRAEADFPGGLMSDHATTGGTEWAYGAAPWLELGLFTPILTVARAVPAQAPARTMRARFDGAELRALLMAPQTGAPLTYGVDVALQMNSPSWDSRPLTVELRPVLSWRAGPWRWIINPILEGSLHGFAALQFTPAERLDYTVSARWQLGVEEYADDTGPVTRELSLRSQSQRLFAVADVRVGAWTAEPGVGLGLTPASDRLTLKLMLSRDLR
jgi:hypothetical protein